MKKGLIDPGLENPKQITNLIMNIVTVTCTRDKFAMLLQAQSINLFVTEKITHYVIIQDSTTSYTEWNDLLRPYYQLHDLEIISNWLDNDLNGWTQQQILKFEAAKFINTDHYLILDSKNLFIKSTDLSEFALEGHRHYINTSLLTKQYNQWYRYIDKNLKVTFPKMSWVPQTPFTVNTRVINQIVDINLEKFFIDFNNRYPNDHPSEFLLYRFFSEPPKNKHNYQHIIWDRKFLKQLNDFDDEVICLGIHREALNDVSSTHTDVLNLIEWLVDLQFDEQSVLNFVNSFTRP